MKLIIKADAVGSIDVKLGVPTQAERDDLVRIVTQVTNRFLRNLVEDAEVDVKVTIEEDAE